MQEETETTVIAKKEGDKHSTPAHPHHTESIKTGTNHWSETKINNSGSKR